MSTNSKDIYKQLEEALLRIDILEKKTKDIEKETTNKYLKIIYDLEENHQKKVIELEDKVSSLQSKVTKYELEIDRLRNQVKKTVLTLPSHRLKITNLIGLILLTIEKKDIEIAVDK